MSTNKQMPEADKDGERATLGLLANGSSGPWDINLDEYSGERDKYFVQIEGPVLYLYFEIPSPRMIGTMLQYLQRRSPSASVAGKTLAERTEALRIGAFGRASVNLVWDDEFVDRCFLIVGVSGKPSLRLTLWGEEIRHLSDALRQVLEDLDDIESSDPGPAAPRRS
jgi:hypothetical protein